MTADMRALLWIIGAIAMMIGAVLVGLPVALIVAGYVLMSWARR
jgi:hypothetical protein